MGFWTTLIFVIVIIHFVVGFGYLIYKLSPKKKNVEKGILEQNADE